MNRPVLVATLGMIIGILGGLYLRLSAVPLFVFMIFFIYFFFNKNWLRYLKTFFSMQMIIILFCSAVLSFVYTRYKNNEFLSIIPRETNELIGVIKSEVEEKKYTYCYTVQIKELQSKRNIRFRLYVKKKKGAKAFEYGDVITLNGEIELPEEARNYGGFSQRDYYKSKGIYGIIYAEADSAKLISKGKFSIVKVGNNIRASFKETLRKYVSEKNANILLAILIGDKEEISGDTLEKFQTSSLIHILCVSGAHVSFLILGVQKLLDKFGRKRKYLLSLLAIAMLICITGFSPSVTRACIMGVMMILSKLLFRSSDTINAVSLSLLILLINNPFILFDTGLLLSYGGTIGILSLAKIGEEKAKRWAGTSPAPTNSENNVGAGHVPAHDNKIRAKLKSYIIKTVIVSTSAQVILMPIIAYLFCTIHPTFFISNLIATPLFEILILFGYVFLIISYIFPPICYFLAIPLNLCVTIFLKTAELSSKLPLAQINVVKPNIAFLIIYYLAAFVIRYFVLLYEKNRTPRYFERKLKNRINFIKSKITKKKAIAGILSVLLLFQAIKILPSSFFIYFVDVGQGDCTLVQTPNNKTIMIDSGGAENLEEYDVGKQVLVPYLLARGITELDYIMVSHFHADHCNGFIAVMNEIKVGTLLMAKQEIYTKETERIMNLAKQKNIKIVYVETGQKIRLDNSTTLEILHIGKDTQNLNNNSIIARIKYNNFSILFTGDAEKEEEADFLKEYEKQNKGVDVLKVGHHGSPTSSTQEFINAVKPKIALIGVGEKNNFGHPNADVIERLKQYGAKIYRTDKSGEISITVDSKGRIKVKKFIE